jgi:hypothetical protein
LNLVTYYHYTSLNRESPSDIIITQIISLFSVLRLCNQSVSLLVLSVQGPPSQTRDTNIHTQICQRKRMSQDIPRRSLSSIELSSQHSAEVSDCNLHSSCCSSLCLSRYVDSRERQCQCGRRVNAGSSEEGTDVTDTWVPGWVFVRDEDDVADDAGQRGCHDEDVSAAEFFGGDGVDNC